MLECLDIINFQDCDNDAPITIESYIEVNKTIMAHLANEDEHTVENFQAKMLNVSKGKVLADIQVAETDLQFNHVAESMRFIPQWVFVSFQGGVRIINTEKSPLTRIQITQIQFLPRTEDTFNIIIDDGKGSPVTIPITNATLNSVNLVKVENYITDSKIVKISADNGLFGTFTNSDPTCYTCGGASSSNISLHGLADNGDPSGIYTGFFPTAILICSSEDVICKSLNNRAILAKLQEAISYQVGVRVYERFLLSPRQNDTTININKEAVKEYKDIIQGKYVEVINGKKGKVTGVVELITDDLNRGDFCIKCNSLTGTSWGVV